MAKPKSKYQPTPKGGAKHFSVTVPNDLLKKINARAKRDGISRSYLTVQAMSHFLNGVVGK